jgi:hypothetical protein
MAERTEKTLDERFDEVKEAFRDHRDFTVFCFDKLRRELRQEIRQSEGRVTRRLDRHELVLGEILSEVKAINQAGPTGSRRRRRA